MPTTSTADYLLSLVAALRREESGAPGERDFFQAIVDVAHEAQSAVNTISTLQAANAELQRKNQDLEWVNSAHRLLNALVQLGPEPVPEDQGNGNGSSIADSSSSQERNDSLLRDTARLIMSAPDLEKYKTIWRVERLRGEWVCLKLVVESASLQDVETGACACGIEEVGCVQVKLQSGKDMFVRRVERAGGGG